MDFDEFEQQQKQVWELTSAAVDDELPGAASAALLLARPLEILGQPRAPRVVTPDLARLLIRDLVVMRRRILAGEVLEYGYEFLNTWLVSEFTVADPGWQEGEVEDLATAWLTNVVEWWDEQLVRASYPKFEHLSEVAKFTDRLEVALPGLDRSAVQSIDSRLRDHFCTLAERIRTAETDIETAIWADDLLLIAADCANKVPSLESVGIGPAEAERLGELTEEYGEESKHARSETGLRPCEHRLGFTMAEAHELVRRENAANAGEDLGARPEPVVAGLPLVFELEDEWLRATFSLRHLVTRRDLASEILSYATQLQTREAIVAHIAAADPDEIVTRVRRSLAQVGNSHGSLTGQPDWLLDEVFRKVDALWPNLSDARYGWTAKSGPEPLTAEYSITEIDLRGLVAELLWDNVELDSITREQVQQEVCLRVFRNGIHAQAHWQELSGDLEAHEEAHVRDLFPDAFADAED